MWNECPQCDSRIGDIETGETVKRQCPLRLADCEHDETPHHYYCTGSCKWQFTEWGCTCYPCRTGNGADCRVLAKHCEAADARLAGTVPR